MSTRRGIGVALAAVVVAGSTACAAQRVGTVAPSTSPSSVAESPTLADESPPQPSALAGAVDVLALPGEFPPLEPGRYYISPVVPDGPAIHVLYTIPAEGWLAFIGGYKPGEDGRDETVAVHILNITNLVRHGCTDHGQAEPAVGDTTEDLANALAALEPFEVVEAPSDVSRWGYEGKHVVLQLPELPTTIAGGQLSFTGCVDREVKSWIGAPLSYAYYGYSPGLIEEFWILDVDGQRLAVIADRFADTPEADLAEMEAVLDSIEFVVAPQQDG